jgi:hypothetical protein
MLTSTNRIRSQSTSLTNRFAKWSTLFVTVSLVALVLFATHVSSNSVKFRTAIMVHAAGRGKPWLNMQDGRELKVEDQGERAQTEALRSGGARALTLATGDFDLDGAPDLLTGYATASGGIVTLQRGNSEAFAPRDPATFKAIHEGRMPPSFLPTVDTFLVPDSPDFLQVGDFNGDGFKDVLVAARGGHGLYLLAGDGVGGLGAPERVNLPGSVTALTTGLFNRGRVSDVAVGINGTDGPLVMVFDGGSDGLRGVPLNYSLPAEATSLTLGYFDRDSFFDLAVAAGQEVDIIHGQGIRRAGAIVDPNSRIERLTLPFTARALVPGEFIWNRDNRKDLAVLADDGTVHTLQPGDLDTRPFTPAETAALGVQQERDELAGREANPETVAPAWQPDETAAWKINDGALQVAAATTDGSVAQAELVASPISYLSAPDLLVLDSGHRQLGILRQIGDQLQRAKSVGSLTPDSQASVALDTTTEPVAVLPMPRKVNGERDLMLLTKGSVATIDIILSPLATITVDRTDDNAAASGCTGAANDCSLRGAVSFANANAGTTISVPAGTYTLSIAGAGENVNATGDLDLIASGTSITGAGAATTIINNNTGDRTFQFSTSNVSLWTGSISGVTVQNTNCSVNATSGGVMLCGGADNTITVSSCTFNNNQISGAVASNGAAISHASFANSDAGDMTVMNSTFTNNTVVNGVGGAIRVLASAGTGVGTPSDTITLCTFDNNLASTNEGGALFLTGGNTGTYTINKCTFTNNTAGIATAGSGGGAIQVSNGNMTASFSRFFKNSANAGGSGNYSVKVSGNGTNNVSSNWWGCNGDPQTPATGCDVLINTGAGTFTVSNRLQLRNTISGANVHNANQIAPGSNATFTGDILGLSSGGSTAPSNLTGLATFPAAVSTIYSNSSPALATSFTPTTGQYVNGVANTSAIFTSNSTKGIATVNAIADNQTLPTSLIIGFTPVFVNSTGSDVSPFASAACGGGANVPCYATMGAAITNVALTDVALVPGVINIQTGGYTESPNFNQGSTVNITATVSNTGSFTFTNGTINANANSISLTGDWTNNGSIFNQGTSTVTFNGSGAQNLNGSAVTQTFNHLTVNKGSSSTLTVGGSTTTLNLNGTLTLTAGTLAAGTASAINVAGNWTNNVGAAAFTPGSGTVTFNSTTAGQTIGGTAASQTFNNLTVSKSGQILNTGGSTTQLDLNGNFSLSAGTFTAPATVNVAGDWTRTSGTTFTPGSGTVNFNGSGARNLNGTANPQTFNNLTINKTSGGSVTGGGSLATLTLNGAMTLTAGTFAAGTITAIGLPGDWTNNGGTFTPGSTTVTFNNTVGAQAINGTNASQTFNNITVAKTAQTLSVGGSTATLNLNGTMTLTSGTFAAGTATGINVTGNWTNNGGTFTPGTGTVTFNSTTAAQAINGTAVTQTFNNLTENKSGQTLTMGGSTTTLNVNDLTITVGIFAAGTATNINVGGNWNNVGGTFSAGTGTVNFTGNNNFQTLGGTNSYNNLTINHTGTGNVSASGSNLTVLGLLRIQGGTFISSSTFKDVQIDSGQTLQSDGSNINVTGNWTNNGTFTQGAGTVTFTSSAATQTISGSTTTTFNNLVINKNIGGVSLSTSITVNGLLTFTSGNITTNANTVFVGSGGTRSQTSGYIIGNEQKTFGGNGSFTFDVGTAAANNYSPLDATVTAGTGTLTVTATPTAQPNLTATQQLNSLHRYWTLTQGGAGITANLVFHYLDADVFGAEANYRIIRVRSGTAVTFPNNCGAGSPCVDTVNNKFTINGVSSFSDWTAGDFNSFPSAADGTISGQIADSNGTPVSGVVIRLSGTQTRKTITDSNGNYHFDNVETNGFYTVTPSRANYNFSPVNRSFSQLGSKTEAAFTGSSGGDTANPLDTPEYFVRQEYVDVLGREPDEGGFNYWSDQINACGNDADCIRSRRISVAAAFFVEEEFQKSGSFIYDVYKGALGRRPVFVEYASDRTQVIGGANLDAEKAAFANSFVQRAEFVAKYQSNVSADSFVDALLQSVQTSGVDLSGKRPNLISTYNSGANTVESRAAVVRAVADNAAFKQAQYNPAFVLTEYFAYLSRDIDQGGYDFWLNVLNNREQGNFRGMVCAFITSTEYQKRFSSVISRSNSECAR